MPLKNAGIGGGVLLLVAARAGLVVLALAGCVRDTYERSLLALDQPVAETGQAGDTANEQRRIRELEQGIRRYRREAERTLKATSQLEVYYKMLATAYMQRGMYQPAYAAVQEALAIQSENPILYYHAAVCAASLSKAQVEAAERERWLQLAAAHYGRALELDPGYVDALYGLAVLEVFERERPQEAVPLLERLLKRERRNTQAQLLLGNAYYRSGRLEDALAVFRDVAAHADLAPESMQEAQANARRIEEELHGAP